MHACHEVRQEYVWIKSRLNK